MRTRTSWSLGGSTSTSHTSQRLGDSNSSAARDFTCPPLHMPDGLILEPPRPGRSPDDDPEMIAGDNQLAAKHCDTGHHAVLTKRRRRYRRCRVQCQRSWGNWRGFVATDDRTL